MWFHESLLCCVGVVVQVLSNSYAFAYFFFGGDVFKGEFTEEQNQMNQNLFEDLQEQLGMEVRTCWTRLLKMRGISAATCLECQTTLEFHHAL